ncbi:MerR family transcriptional regulator [Arenibacter sp. GZD96]|uniref:MerR family transcriptional regulator n=1 Tax=Aurantibrevibacter litoralis TaxID=3106030 RepID=UPI002AFED71D|nr:MerR family transcriptional regulator [Arenibacter sp. GZD-96]MEA1786224.1 MerR family transcriptional regulator [Arenibacter sp. GZD-96]
MNNVKKVFGIKDLENLSGIKAHTIRIWEKRYNLLSPERTDTNIRNYSLASLQKLLNITLLYNNGYKISKIAKMGEVKITGIVKEIIAGNSVKDHAISSFKLAMINFDRILFHNTCAALLENRSFDEVFKTIFIPLLNELGLLWQTDTIRLSHEHFISNLIKEKIHVHLEKVASQEPLRKDKTFVLFLPENEIHEIGLLYLSYEVALKGYKSIYLGQTVPLESLEDFTKFFTNVTFISYFTVEPAKDKMDKYIKTFQSRLGRNNASTLWLLGYQTQYLNAEKMPENIKLFNSIDEVTQAL